MFYYGRDLMRQRVVDATTGRELGRVAQILWDPTSGELLALRVHSEDAGLKTVSRRQISSIDEGQISIRPGAGTMVQAPAGMGKRILTDQGDELGVVTDIIFELETGRVLGYEVTIAGERRIVPAIAPIKQDEQTIVLPSRVRNYLATDLSALMSLRDPETGEVSFPLSEEPPES